MRDYVCRPPAGNTRLYCTMIRRSVRSADVTATQHCHHGHGAELDASNSSNDEVEPTPPPPPPAAPEESGDNESGVAFTLYLEFLGGLVPLLKGKPTSRLKPEFIIYDPYGRPQDQNPVKKATKVAVPASTNPSGGSSRFGQFLSPAMQRKFIIRRPNGINNNKSSDSEPEAPESCVISITPRMPRKFGRVRPSASGPPPPPTQQQAVQQPLPPPVSPLLAQVASNIWGTKFRISGLCPASLPAHLGQVTYKTSLLHLQPRQMTLGVVDLRDPPHPQPASSSSPMEEDDDDVPSEPDEAVSPAREASVAPALTPNLSRMRRRRNHHHPEPPPSPTHQRRQRIVAVPVPRDETIRVEWTGGPHHSAAANDQRIVLAGPVPLPPLPPPAVRLLKWRSLSVDGVVTAASPSVPPARRKSRSLDSSPVMAVREFLLSSAGQHQANGGGPSGGSGVSSRPGIRRSWAVQQCPVARSSRTAKATAGGPSVRTDEPPESQRGAREKHHHQRFVAGLARLSPLLGRKLLGRSSEPGTPNSSPATGRKRPNDRHSSPIRQLLNSPLLARRLGRGRPAAAAASTNGLEDSSDDDDMAGGRSSTTAHNYQDLESFQKAQLLNKLRQTWAQEKAAATASPAAEPMDQPPAKEPERREFVLTNKAPLWNEHSQVYQLDFGGRVTQESAKNFQIEFKGKQVDILPARKLDYFLN